MNSQRPLKILHVCPRPSYSGLESYALTTAEAQAKLGQTIEFVTLENSPLEEKVKTAGFRVHSLGRGPFAFLAFAKKMMEYLTGPEKPDIVHLHSTQDIDLCLIPLAYARLTQGGLPKTVLQIHIWISHPKRDPLHAIAYSLIDEVWCSSQPAKATLEKFLPIPSKKLRIVPYGRDVQKMKASFLPRSEARRALGLPENAIVIGAVARIDQGKGTEELLSSVLSLVGENPDLHLVWIGPPTSDDPKAVYFGREILNRVETLPKAIQARVRFPGSVPDSYRLLKAFDLFALPSYSECFSLSLLEGLSAGLPALGTSSGGTPEVVIPRETGWIFEPRSTEALTAAIRQALQDRSSWTDLSRNAERLVTEKYDLKNILPRTVDAYRELLGKQLKTR